MNYQISPDKVKDAVKCMHFRASKADCVFKGDYILSEDGQVRVLTIYSFSAALHILPNMSYSFWHADRNGSPVSRASVHTCQDAP